MRKRLRAGLPRRKTIATMRDVAERAGVSVTTVSHVINQSRPVSDELRERVLLAMQELGYQPNTLARSLRRGETKTIGIIVPDSANPFFAEVARGIEDTSFENGYSVILCNTDNNLDKESLYTNVLVEKQVDGILFVAAGLSAENIQVLQRRGMPLVIIDRQVTGVQVDSVLTDNISGGKLATRHLIEQGYQNIGLITGPIDWWEARERARGWRDALIDAGLDPGESQIVHGDWMAASGEQGLKRLLEQCPNLDAVFVSNDQMALGVLQVACREGIQVPQELVVVGFDGIPEAAYYWPPLTTVYEDLRELGRTAVRELSQIVEAGHRGESGVPPKAISLVPELIVRESSELTKL